jgi:hypothetical protein
MKYFILLILLTGCTLKEEYQESQLKRGEEYGMRFDNEDPFERTFCNVTIDSVSCSHVRFRVKSNGNLASCSIKKFNMLYTPVNLTCK